MVSTTQVKFVIATPGRVAFTTPAAKEKFTSRPKQVIWTPYLQELYAVHGDIQIVQSPAQHLAAQQAAAKAKAPATDEKPITRAPAPARTETAIAREPATH